MQTKRLAPLALITGALLLGVACTQAASPTPTTGLGDPSGGNTSTLVQNSGDDKSTVSSGAASGVSIPFFSGGVAEAAGYATYASPQANGGYVQRSGIWVGGTGKVTVAPDLATLNLGVEAIRDTAEGAREDAATAMAALMEVLESHGIEEQDIRTQYFNIYPEYTWDDGSRQSRIVGYRVSNSVSVESRDLENLGALIDDVAAAAGDLVRINGISFSVENPDQYAAQAREAAVKDAVAKAEQFASLTEVTLGKLSYIAEVGSNVPIYRDYAKAEMAMAGAADAAVPPTPINPGETDITISVQAIFSIA